MNKLYVNLRLLDVTTNPSLNFSGGLVEPLLKLINHISLFYSNVITYPCSHFDAGLTNFCCPNAPDR